MEPGEPQDLAKPGAKPDLTPLPAGSALSEDGLGPRDWDWDALYANLGPVFVNVAMRRYHLTHEEAEDTLQSAFAKVIDVNPRVRNPGGYLRVAFFHSCLNLAQTLKRLPKDAGLSDVPDQRSDFAERLLAYHTVRGGLLRIEPRCRELLDRYFLHGDLLTSAAEKTGYSAKTASKRLALCLKKIRKCLTT